MVFARVNPNPLVTVLAEIFAIQFCIHAVPASIGQDFQEVVHRMLGGKSLPSLNDRCEEIVAGRIDGPVSDNGRFQPSLHSLGNKSYGLFNLGSAPGEEFGCRQIRPGVPDWLRRR